MFQATTQGEAMWRSSRGFLVAAALALPGCGDDTAFAPSLNTVSGDYHATTLTTTQAGITTDLLLLGAALSVVLSLDGTTTGRLLAPGLGENGEDVDEDLTGTWTLTGSTVHFQLASDTFIPDVPFTAELNRLSAERTANGATLRVVLTK
jgi:hypothetical protein